MKTSINNYFREKIKQKLKMITLIIVMDASVGKLNDKESVHPNIECSQDENTPSKQAEDFHSRYSTNMSINAAANEPVIKKAPVMAGSNLILVDNGPNKKEPTSMASMAPNMDLVPTNNPNAPPRRARCIRANLTTVS